MFWRNITPWRPAMDRAKKAESIEELKSVFADNATVVVTQYTGMTLSLIHI